MVFKLIEVTTSEERVRAITSVAEEMKVTDIQVGPSLGDGRRVIRLLAGEMDRQTLLDRLQAALGKSENWRIMMLPTDVVVPREPEQEQKPGTAEEENKKREQERASREELYNSVAGGARIDSNFILLVVLSTVVASVGLEQDNIAVVIGAMVIAPLAQRHEPVHQVVPPGDAAEHGLDAGWVAVDGEIAGPACGSAGGHQVRPPSHAGNRSCSNPSELTTLPATWSTASCSVWGRE